MELFNHDYQSWLAVAIRDLEETQIHVVHPIGAPPPPFRILIDSELMLVMQLPADGGAWSVQRGIEGTQAACHGQGASVRPIVTLQTIRELIATSIGVIDPTHPDYGAVGNGSTNDAPAIQKAIDVAVRQGGGNVLLHKGKFRIGSPITLGDNVTLVGQGPGATHILADDTDAFISRGSTGVAIQDLLITGQNKHPAGKGSAILIDAGNTSNIRIRNVHCRGMLHAIRVTCTGLVTHGEISFCLFAYNAGDHVLIEDGAEINSVVYHSTRFEQNGVNACGYRAHGVAKATSGTKFLNCVFEGMISNAAVYLGDNPFSYSFIGCHFEANGINQEAACDVFVGGGRGCVLIEGCMFAPCSGSAKGFFSIRKTRSPTLTMTAIGNMFLGASQPGYRGAVQTEDVPTLIGNSYSGRGAVTTVDAPPSGNQSRK